MGQPVPNSCARVRYESNFPARRPGREGLEIVKGFRMPAGHRTEGLHGGRRPKSLESLRVFGCLPVIGQRGCTEAGVRKASREETAGEFAPMLMSIYGEFAAAA